MDKRALLTAAALLLALVLWLVSGHLMSEEEQPPVAREQQTGEPFLVEARMSEAQPVVRNLSLQGQTRANRRVVLRAETAGPVAEMRVAQGDRVAQGEPLLRLSQAERASRLQQARALLEQREVAYEAARELAQEGFQSRIEARQAYAALQQAQAEVQAAEEALRQTVIRAPFAGVIDQRLVELGDYLAPGGEVAVLLDTQPMVIQVDVPQQEIRHLSVDKPARARPIGGNWTDGRIRYIAVGADAATRTFPIEVEILNEDGRIRAGMSAEVQIALETRSAHLLSPALLSLNAEGVLGVKTVDDEGRVNFHPVELVRSQAEGVWVEGLPQQARVISVGQGFVESGQQVRVRMVEQSNKEPGR